MHARSLSFAALMKRAGLVALLALPALLAACSKGGGAGY
jgi:hypothetical protein